MNEYVPNEYLRRLKEMKAEKSDEPEWMRKARAAGWVPPEEDWQREARKHGWRPRIPDEFVMQKPGPYNKIVSQGYSGHCMPSVWDLQNGACWPDAKPLASGFGPYVPSDHGYDPGQ